MSDYEIMSKQKLIGELKRMLMTVPPEDSLDSIRLLHELQVHQIELEMQNRELREAQEELQKSYERYYSLFDFAPVGYVTIDDAGCVKMANLTLASMLGVERSELIACDFSLFVAPADLPIYRNIFRHWGMNSETRITALNLINKAGNGLAVQMHTQTEYGNAGSRLDFRSAITERKRDADHASSASE